MPRARANSRPLASGLLLITAAMRAGHPWLSAARTTGIRSICPTSHTVSKCPSSITCGAAGAPYLTGFMDSAELTRIAETYGFSHAWTLDSHVLWQEPSQIYTAMLAA